MPVISVTSSKVYPLPKHQSAPNNSNSSGLDGAPEAEHELSHHRENNGLIFKSDKISLCL